jgi:hypothetical protein
VLSTKANVTASLLSKVSSVSATSPIASSGGLTPTISISQSSGSTNGYLSSTDWNTFNNKGSGSVTSVATDATMTGGTITTSGTLKVDTSVMATRLRVQKGIDSLGAAKQTALNGTGFVKASGTTISYDNSTYYLASNPSGFITGNQTITLSGDVSGSGATAITTTIGSLKVTNGMLAGSINYSKMDATTVPTWNQNTTGTAANITATSNSTITTLSALSLPYSQLTGTPSLSGYVTSVTGTSPIVSSGGTTPAISIPAATSSVNGYLTSTDWTTFNNKQSALTNPVTGTGTTNYLPKFTGASTIGNSLVRDDGSGVSIGIAPQTDKLFIYNASGTNTGLTIQQDGTGDIIRLNGNGGANRLVLQQGGNLGLGVTPSVWYSSSKAFEISYAGNSIWSYGQTNVYLTSNSYFNTSNQWTYGGSGAASLFQQDGGAFAWKLAPSGTAGNAISFTQAMTLTASGNLLVGTITDAGYKLQVSGTGFFTSNLGIGGSFGTSPNNTILSLPNGVNIQSRIAAGIPQLAMSANIDGDWYSPTYKVSNYAGQIYIDANQGTIGLRTAATGTAGGSITWNTPAIYIANNSNVLIGTTTDAGYKLDVNGTGRFSGQLSLSSGSLALKLIPTANSTYGSANYAQWYRADGTTSRAYVGYGSGNDQRFQIATGESGGSLELSSGNNVVALTLASTGAATFSSLSGTGSRIVVADASGTLSATTAAPTSGTYTPTSQDYANVTSATNYTAQYMRVGNVVTVSGKITPVTTTGGVFSYLTLSLPIAPNFTTEQQAAGTGTIKNNVSSDLNATIYAEIYGGQYVLFQYFTTLSGGHDIFYQFTYLIN